MGSVRSGRWNFRFGRYPPGYVPPKAIEFTPTSADLRSLVTLAKALMLRHGLIEKAVDRKELLRLGNEIATLLPAYRIVCERCVRSYVVPKSRVREAS